MTTINSEYIKNNVACIHCNSKHIKRNYKKTFKSKYNSEIKLIPETIEWRQFVCKSCKEHTNVLNNSTSIISVSKDVILPLSAFLFYFDEDIENISSVWIFFSDELREAYNNNIIDIPNCDLRENNILFFEQLLKDNQYIFSNLSESNFIIIPEEYEKNLIDYEWGDKLLNNSEKESIKSFLIKYGSEYSEEY